MRGSSGFSDKNGAKQQGGKKFEGWAFRPHIKHGKTTKICFLMLRQLFIELLNVYRLTI